MNISCQLSVLNFVFDNVGTRNNQKAVTTAVNSFPHVTFPQCSMLVACFDKAMLALCKTQPESWQV